MSSPVTPQANSKDTGVTNGDVDWLFRGKLKKPKGAATADEIQNSPKAPKAPIIPSPNDKPPQVTSPTAEVIQTAPSANREYTQNEKEAQSPPKVTHSPHTTSALGSAISKSLKPRSRSSSLSSTLTRKSIDSADQRRVSTDLERKGSVSSGSGVGVSAATSAGIIQGSKKSLFSSISSKFGKKKPASSATSPSLSSGSGSLSPIQSSVSNSGASQQSGGATSASNSAISSPLSTKPPPSSLSDNPDMSSSVKSPISDDSSPNIEAKKRFGSLRGKVAARIASGRTVQPPGPSERVILNKNPNKFEVPIESLNNLKMKRVTFDLNNIGYDPPQQIPPRKPKVGNVLIPEDLIAEVPKLSVGIANSEKKIVDANSKKELNQKQYAMAVESQKRALEEAKKHAQEAHLSAVRIATEVANYKVSKNGHLMPTLETSEEDGVFHEGGVDIDKPMHLHEHHFNDDNSNTADGNVSTDKLVDADDVSLDILYTRCCHLREILPIPATLKQLKSKSKPLHVLKFLNPKPTLIDVLSFSDFISIAPINTIIFDNVALTNEMIKIVLTSLANNTALEKLSLKNLMIDEESWKYLCKFLLKNKSLLKLDLSQTKYRSDLSPEFYRFNMDWKLFVKVLKNRNGIMELILTGIDLRIEDFKILIEKGISIKTKRLGLASSNISLEKCEIISSWINKENSTCEGIDFGFNDMSKGQLSKLKITNLSSKLLFVSLNSTALSDVKELSVFLKSLSELPNVSYLDLSCLPDIIPQSVAYFKRYLPKFPNLKRIHLDYNYIPPKSLAAILDILQNCKKLIHVSLIGNDVHAVSASLYSCIKSSRSIFNLNIDFDSIPELISSRIAVVLMRNMEINLHGGETAKSDDNDLEDELIFDGSLIAESAEAFLKIKNSGEDVEDYSNKILKKSLVSKTKVIRAEIHNTIDALFVKRNQGELTIEGKERLLRFCLLDSALEKIVHIFESSDDNSNIHRNLTRSNTDTNSILTNGTMDELGTDFGELTPMGTGSDIESQTPDKSEYMPPREDEYMHNLSKDYINTNETISPELNTIQSSEIQYLNPQQAQIPAITQVEIPHQLANEKSTDGKEVSVDTTTGRPVLFRNYSSTSVNAKKQEEEEGELHRWGFFVQQHRQLYPDETPFIKPATTTATTTTTAASAAPAAPAAKTATPLTNTPKTSANNSSSTIGSSSEINPKLLSLITGEQLRKAVIKAKGINSINELIDKVEHNDSEFNKIYKVPEGTATDASALQTGQSSIVKSEVKSADTTLEANSEDQESIDSIDSMKNQVNDLNFEDDEKAVDETYDKLLNDVIRVRSNK